MNKNYHSVISAVASIAFIVILQTFAAPNPVFRFLLPAVLLFSLAVQAYNSFRLRQLNKFSYLQILSSFIFFLGWFGVFILLPNSGIRGVFLLISLPIVFFMEYLLDNHGEHIVHAKTLLIILAVLYSVVGLEYYYKMDLALILLLLFLLVFLVVKASFEQVPRPEREKLVISICLGLFVAEFFWAQMFLPFHYSVVALSVFNFFYVCWSLTYYQLFNKISRKRIQFHIGLASALTIVLMLLTQWSL